MQPLSKGWAPRRAAVPHCGIIHVALLQVQEMEVGGVSASRGQPLSKGWAPCRAAASHCGIEYMWHFVAQQARFFTGGSGGWPPENRPLGAIAPPLVIGKSDMIVQSLHELQRGCKAGILFILFALTIPCVGSSVERRGSKLQGQQVELIYGKKSDCIDQCIATWSRGSQG